MASGKETDPLERTVYVSPVAQAMKEDILTYLESSRQGGGPIEREELDGDRTLVVCFKEKAVAERVLKKQRLTVQGVDYTITNARPEKIRRSKQPKDSSKPSKEINILLLGETGVGKSTWINGFANYLTYPTLQEAKENNMITLIPMSFTMTDNDYRERVITAGKAEENENHQKVGQSCTQSPKTYRFDNDYLTVRLIDTPGIGDTRGIDQDKENFNNILAHIATFEALHGIFILLKPNQARITVQFEYCIKELLKNLHKDACRNIVVCFTNARSTFYQPGDTMPAIKKVFRDSDFHINLDRKTTYCIDNEAVRFLAASNDGNIGFKPAQEQDFTESWNTSVRETGRLMEYISSLKPHLVKETISINNARYMILGLTKPLADVTALIQKTLAAIMTKREELTESRVSKEELAKHLYIPIIETQELPLKPRQRVCTSKKCATEIKDDKGTRMYYLCSVGYNKRFSDNFNFGSPRKCDKCGCEGKVHETISYLTVTTEKQVMNTGVGNQILGLEASIKAISQFLEKTAERIAEFEKEQKYIRSASVRFACFLKKYAITPYNDVMNDYLKFYIRQSERDGTSNNSTLKGLKKMHTKYLQEVEQLQASMEKCAVTPPTADDVEMMISTLYGMKHFGEKIKQMTTVVQESENDDVKETEVIVPSVARRSSSMINILQQLVETSTYHPSAV